MPAACHAQTPWKRLDLTSICWQLFASWPVVWAEPAKASVFAPPPQAGGSTRHSPQDSICTQEQQQRSEQRQNLKHPSPSGSGSGSRTACLLSDKAGHKALSRQLCTDLAVSAGNVWAWDKGAGNVSCFHLGLWQQCGGAVIRASRPAGACSVTLSMGSLSRGP